MGIVEWLPALKNRSQMEKVSIMDTLPPQTICLLHYTAKIQSLWSQQRPIRESIHLSLVLSQSAAGRQRAFSRDSGTLTGPHFKSQWELIHTSVTELIKAAYPFAFVPSPQSSAIKRKEKKIVLSEQMSVKGIVHPKMIEMTYID